MTPRCRCGWSRCDPKRRCRVAASGSPIRRGCGCRCRVVRMDSRFAVVNRMAIAAWPRARSTASRSNTLVSSTASRIGRWASPQRGRAVRCRSGSGLTRPACRRRERRWSAGRCDPPGCGQWCPRVVDGAQRMNRESHFIVRNRWSSSAASTSTSRRIRHFSVRSRAVSNASSRAWRRRAYSA